MATEHPDPTPGWLAALDRRRRETAYGLFGLGAVLIAVAVVLIVKFHWQAVVEILACFAFGLILLVSGYVHLPKEGGEPSNLNATRRLVLVIGGAFGFFLLVIAFGRAIGWMSYFTGGVEAWQGEGAWRVWLCVFLALAGLGVMFASLMLARTEERTNVVLRRSLYGYNAVLTGLLLLALLTILNIMAFVYVPKVWDWTSAGLYTLSSQSVNLLTHLEKPLKIYVLLSGREGPLAEDLHNLMDNCQTASNKVQVEYLSRDRNLERLRDLTRRYGLIESQGLLVVYGTEPDQQHQFIRSQDLWEASKRRGPQEQGGLVFKGEEALMATVRQLEEGKAKAIIYFTQGNGELDINDSAVTELDRGAGLLRDRLQKANYEVKGLHFTSVEATKASNPNVVVAKTVPSDAAVVVVANPRNRLPDGALKALHDYMKPADPKQKKGKLVVLLDVDIQGGKMVQTGLEGLLAEFNVTVDNDQVLTPNEQNPLQVLVMPNPSLQSSNNLAAAFEGRPIPMYQVRTVRARSTPMPPGGTTFQAASLLLVANEEAWAENDLSIEPIRYVHDLRQNHLSQDRRKEIITKLNNRANGREELPVAVAVTESTSAGDPNDPHRFMRQQPATDQKPRMVVFGDATFASNVAVNRLGADFLTSSLAWLRERPEAIGITPKSRDLYQLSPNTNVSRMVFLPFVLMSCAVIGLGLGVWVVRRR